jgi:putative glutamine amidotransferase
MKPIIAILCDTGQQGPHIYHQAGDKYIQALLDCADVTPLLIPALSDPADIANILSAAHGLLLPGGYSNIERQRYGLPAAPDGEHQDPTRDKTALGMIPSVLKSGLPFLAICRGFQELNVAVGGTLYPRLQEAAGRMDHREDTSQPIDIQYGPAHSVSVRAGGLLAEIVGTKNFMVNSVHGQGINRLAEGLTAEAWAEDQTIEAVSVDTAKGFALAVQWHPEWNARKNPQSKPIFRAFGDAAHAYKAQREVL